ncbi:MAG: molecular chaperone SurA [Halobacteria archaeon]|nr:molecular chaperone SurA [Halobacteria archaeon]
MKSLIQLIGLALAVLPLAGNAQTENSTASAPRLLNRIVAVVNDDIITHSELDSEMVSISAELQKKDTQLPPRAILEKQVLERLIVERLQLQLAENSGIRIDDTTLNSKLQEVAMANGLTLTQFRDVLERDGYDYAGFREDLRQELVINQLRQQMVGSRLKVSDQEVENLLANLEASDQGNAQYHLAHILIAVPEAASPAQIQAAQQRAERVLASLTGGADFSRTAIAESDGQTALDGGDIGWRSLGQMPTLFVEPLKSLQPGQVSEPIRSPSGFHIIKLIEQRGGERYVVNQTRVRHILLKPDTLHSDEETRVRLEQLEQRLRGGEDFATLAKSNSQDTLSAAKGGDLGWVNPGDLVPAFEETMDRLPPGQLSQPFKSQFGWHILEVLERREHDSTEEYKRSRARQLIRSRKSDEQLLLWLRRLRDESYVEYRLES